MPTAEAMSLNGRRILIADEQAHSRKFIADLCRSFGANELGQADSSDLALAALETGTWEILLCTWGNKLDAPALIRRIRAQTGTPYQRTRIVVLRAGAKAADVEASRDAGADEFLTMPLSQGPLSNVFRRIATQPQHFVESDAYKGPCRRRRRLAWETERRRVEGQIGKPPSPADDDTIEIE